MCTQKNKIQSYNLRSSYNQEVQLKKDTTILIGTLHILYVKNVCTQSNIYFLSIKPSGSFDRPVLQWYFATQNCSDLLDENYSSDWENLLKFETEGREFENFWKFKQIFTYICTFGFGFGFRPKARCFSGQIFGFGLKWKPYFRSFTAIYILCLESFVKMQETPGKQWLMSGHGTTTGKSSSMHS